MKPTIKYTWGQFDKDMMSIASKHLIKKNYDVIIGLTRGGGVPAIVLSHILNTKKLYYFDPKVPPAGDELDYIDWERDKILIIDDINDTGNTIKNIKEIILRDYISDVDEFTDEDKEVDWENLNIDIFTIFERFSSPETSTFSCHEILDDSWVIFPWEEPMNHL